MYVCCVCCVSLCARTWPETINEELRFPAVPSKLRTAEEDFKAPQPEMNSCNNVTSCATNVLVAGAIRPYSHGCHIIQTN